MIYYSVDSSGNRSSSSTGNSTVTFTYNALGQVATRTEATGDSVTYAYDHAGRLASQTDSAFTDYTTTSVQRQTLYSYDALNDLTQTIERAAGTTGNDRTTTYTYGAGGRLASMTDAASFVMSYGYDAAGRVKKESWTRTKSDGSTTVTEAKAYRYDAADQRIFLRRLGPSGRCRGRHRR